MPTTAPPASAAAPQAVRHLGRFQLLRLLGKSVHTMAWLVADEAAQGLELVLVMPRERPADAAATARWLDSARRAARVDHPGLAMPMAVGEEESWPYLAYERGQRVLLSEQLGPRGWAPTELAAMAVQVLEGLAFAHEAGLAHRDLQPFMWVLDESGGAQLIGLGALPLPAQAGSGTVSQRQAAERDVLAIGLLLYLALTGSPALGELDLQKAIGRMAPLGHDTVRLPRADVQAIPEPLRAIVDRATDRQERQRYRSARTLLRALAGWMRIAGEAEGSPLTLLLDRMRVVGLLPAMPGAAARARRLQGMTRERTDQLADLVLDDVALSFELLRAVNLASQRVGITGGNGPILTVRRAIAMLGLDGVRRAANVLKPWPGPLGEDHAAELALQFGLAHHAGRVARWLRPAGYDGEWVYLLAVLQRLGRLVVQYHFPDEALQIRRLMQAAPAARPGDQDEPGMSEQGAAFAVLGTDLDALGAAVARHWGLGDSVLYMMRRQPLGAPVHPSGSDAELLRLTASCANETIDAQAGPVPRRQAALHQVALRYGRVLGVTLAEIQAGALDIPPEERQPRPAVHAASHRPESA